MDKKYVLYIAILVTLIALVGVVYFFYLDGGSKNTSNNEALIMGSMKDLY